MRGDDIPAFRADEFPNMFTDGIPWCQICGAMIGYDKNNAYGYRGPTQYQVSAWQINHTIFHQQSISRIEARAMSAVRWCDNGEHPFKEGIEGSESGTVSKVIKDENGNKKTVSISVDICPDHTMSAMTAKVAEDAKKSIRSEAPYGRPGMQFRNDPETD